MNVMPRAVWTRGAMRAGLATCVLVAVVTLAGCGAGQQSQTAAQEPGVDGTSATVSNIALRDVRMRALQTSEAVQPGKTVDLLFTATNQSADVPDRLLSITSDIGPVSVNGNATIPPLGSLVVAPPDNPLATQLGSVAPASTATATVALSKPISNGMSYNFTFTFERAGQTTFPVPVSAAAGAMTQNKA